MAGAWRVSDIISDEDSPESLKNDARLWSGCISGALTEEGFGQALEARRLSRHHHRQVRNGAVANRCRASNTAAPHIWLTKRQAMDELDKNQAVIYLGPFSSITDDNGNTYQRGERTAVSAKTFGLLQQEPYTDMFAYIEPAVSITDEVAFTCCTPDETRDPKDTKKGAPKLTTDPSQGSSCC